MSDALDFLSPAARAALEALIDRRVELAERESGRESARSPYMTVLDAAEYLRCSRQRVYDLQSDGTLRRFKEGGRTLVARADVEALVEVDRPDGGRR